MFNKECNLSNEEIQVRAEEMLSQMTLKEKVWLLNGNWNNIENKRIYDNSYNPVPIETNGCDRLDITPIKFSDGPRGVVMGNSTCFPVSMARGASFDRDLESRIGDVIGKECRAQGANYFAGVCINLLRHPAWGRAQETYGEDPYHIGEFGKALTEAVQDHNVMACLKHYALNQIENSRFFLDVQCDERTLREVYLPHFKKAVDAGAASLMGAYNKFRGEHTSESKYLLTDILRDEWGFEGFTSSDFLFAIRDTEKAIHAGMDIEMPMPIFYQKHLLKAVEEGRVSEKVIDTSVLRIIKTLMVFENAHDKMDYTKDLVANEEHIALAREAAEKSMVLIKNESVLPFNKDVKKVLLLGKLAKKANTGDMGSSRIIAPYVVTQLEGFQNYFNDDVEILHYDESEIELAKEAAKTVDCVVIIAGNDCYDEGEFVVPNPEEAGCDMGELMAQGHENQGNIEIAQHMRIGFQQKKKAESYTGSDEGDQAMGGDRKCLSLKAKEIELIKEVGGINPNTVVTLIGGSMLMTKEWDHIVPSIIYAWYSGMEGGNVLPCVLFGDVNPSGKLPFTIPQDESHLPYFSSTDREITYDLYHGYRLLDRDGHKAAYPFGFGLSYTTYAYKGMGVVDNGESVDVTVTVRNTGHVSGEEIIQVYVGMNDSKIERHKKVLKGFDKVFIKAGESKTITIPVQKEELKYFSNSSMKWEFENGVYSFMVGPSSDETTLLVKELEI